MNHCERIITDKPLRLLHEIERSLITTYRKDIFKPFVKAINEYLLIEPGDKIAVAISGGKDSLILAKLLQELKRHNKIPFELKFISMDPGFLNENRVALEKNCQSLNIPIEIKESNIFRVIEKIAKEQPCYMCARMRRGFLYKHAQDLGCNKLALGHHFDDVIETTLLSMFYNGQFKTMVPKLHAENFEGLELIRPLLLVKEKDIIRWVKYAGINAMNCGCTVTAEKTASKRREVKELIKTLKKLNPDIDQAIFTSATNVNIDAILGYYQGENKIHFNDLYKERKNK
ncbi:MAG: ATP-binding protein [Acholeplasmataceae bacterium]